MFSIFKKDPKKELQKEYQKLMKDAVDAQRNGDIETYSILSAKADDVDKELDQLSDS